MGRVFLRLTDDDFWGMEPRVLFVMIREFRKTDINRMKLKAHIASGGEVDDGEDEAPVYIDVHPDAF